jgi:hypothetical protein
MKNWVGLAFWFATRWPDLSATAAAETTKAAATAAAVTENGFRYEKLRERVDYRHMTINSRGVSFVTIAQFTSVN